MKPAPLPRSPAKREELAASVRAMSERDLGQTLALCAIVDGPRPRFVANVAEQELARRGRLQARVRAWTDNAPNATSIRDAPSPNGALAERIGRGQ